jgi:hypothetical protein
MIGTRAGHMPISIILPNREARFAAQLRVFDEQHEKHKLCTAVVRSFALCIAPCASHSAAIFGYVPVLEWMAKKDASLLPTIGSANGAALGGHLAVLEWMAARDPPILPSSPQ